MTGSRSASFTSNTPHSQRGVILLIALIMLVAMTLAAIGMMRSADTGSVIAGNLAFREATLNAGDAGLSQGVQTLMALPSLTNDAPASGYYSSPGAPGAGGSPCEILGLTSITVPNSINATPCLTPSLQSSWWTRFNWNAAPAIPVNDPINPGNIAMVQYVIHRMCLMNNQPASNTATAIGAQTQFCNASLVVPPCHTIPCPPNLIVYLYRITTRSVGVRNTVTYAQSQIMKG